MNRMPLDDRILFPGPVLAGFAKIDLARRESGIRVHGLLNRGCDNISVAATHGDREVQIGVRFRKPNPALVIVTTIHRKVRKVRDGFAFSEDETREYVAQDPDNRLVLKPGRAAFMATHAHALSSISWDKARFASEMRRVAEESDRLCLEDGPVAYGKGGFCHYVLPLPDYFQNPEKMRLIPRLAA